MRRIENAFAVGEFAITVSEIDKLKTFPVKASNICDRLRNFLPIRAHVLNRRTADKAGDPA